MSGRDVYLDRLKEGRREGGLTDFLLRTHTHTHTHIHTHTLKEGETERE